MVGAIGYILTFCDICVTKNYRKIVSIFVTQCLPQIIIMILYRKYQIRQRISHNERFFVVFSIINFLQSVLRIKENLVSKLVLLPIYYVGGNSFMPNDKEKLIICELMRELIGERRGLSMLYHDFKKKLDHIMEKDRSGPNFSTNSLMIIVKEKLKQQEDYIYENKTQNCIFFDRVSRAIVSILKGSPIPLSNMQILDKLIEKYEAFITLKNLTSNVLPKMNSECSLPVQKAYREYWKYKLLSKEGSSSL